MDLGLQTALRGSLSRASVQDLLFPVLMLFYRFPWRYRGGSRPSATTGCSTLAPKAAYR